MINGPTLERVNKAKARRTHVERKQAADYDAYGSTVATRGKVNRPPLAVASYDGTFTTQRLRDLARMLGRPGSGFVVSPRNGNQVDTGYAVSVHPERETRVGGFVGWRDLMDFMRDNWDLLSHPRAALSAWRDPATGHKFLNVCTVVGDLSQAKVFAHMHGRRMVVRMADGNLCRV